MGMIKNFFNKSIEDNKYPFGSKECASFLKETYQNSIDETIILTEDIYEKLQRYDEINETLGKLDIEKKTIEHFLQNEMKEYETAFCKERKITWKPVQKNTLDTKSIKKYEPEIASKYSKISSTRMFKIY